MKASPVSSLEHEKRNQRTEAAIAPFTFHAAMLGIKPIDIHGEQEHEEGEAASMKVADTSKLVRRFVLACASVPSAGSGYIGLQKGEELVALHAEGDWYFGFVLLDPQRRGWFARCQVSSDHVGSPTSPNALS